ncbi:DNA-binding GntR family transcriptional regulator [Saccharothrix coeruleofusca]|nr:DNA-binding GntR family transcriptional regulator [Saccharothrix coeruleofusca]
MRQLAEQGLVDIKPNSGVEVRATSNEAAYGLADLRADARGIASELLDASQTLASLAKRVEDLQDRAKRLDIK